MNLPLSDAQVERAAREYCRLMGLDPDQRVGLPSPPGSMVYLQGPQWQAYALSVRSTAAMIEALAFMERAPE